MSDNQSLLREESFAERLAHRFHETYETAAPYFDYETRKDSAVPWEEVPEANRRLMIYVCEQIANDLRDHVLALVDGEVERWKKQWAWIDDAVREFGLEISYGPEGSRFLTRQVAE